MTPDVSTGDPTRLFCLNCARRVVSPKSVPKYGGLTTYLKFRAAFTDTVKLSFARIDGVIGDNLPMNAYKSERWWDNMLGSEHAKAWLDAGWETREVNLKNGYVVFKKTRTVNVRRSRMRHDQQIKKPFSPVRVRFPKPRVPSKTKVSKLYARIKNLERQKTALPKHRGSLRPKPKYEKRLFKSGEKPQ